MEFNAIEGPNAYLKNGRTCGIPFTTCTSSSIHRLKDSSSSKYLSYRWGISKLEHFLSLRIFRVILELSNLRSGRCLRMVPAFVTVTVERNQYNDPWNTIVVLVSRLMRLISMKASECENW